MSDLRDAVPGDAPAIAAIYNESIGARDSTMQLEAVTAETVEGWIRGLGEREAVLVVVEDDAVVGYGVVKRYSDRGGYRYAAETSVYLRRARTGEELGSMLQAALIERCRVYGYHHLVAKLWAENEPSRALHRKFGYESVGVQREIGYVDGTWRDVLILQKRLDASTTGE
jgi:L-amino acid N-acyltransferase YncA